MNKKNLLDSIEKADSRRFSMMSFRVFLLTIFILLLFVVLAVINPKNTFFEYFILILAASFVLSNLAGVILTIISVSSRESDSVYKTIGAIGNLFLFLVMLGMVAFVIHDLSMGLSR